MRLETAISSYTQSARILDDDLKKQNNREAGMEVVQSYRPSRMVSMRSALPATWARASWYSGES